MASSSGGGGDSDPFLLGFIVTQIVGMQYYTGKITGREPVGLVRQPLNPHDGNAISVVNRRGDQVGHIKRDAAAALAPLIDSHLVMAHGIVPKTASKSAHRLPCQVHIFARPTAAPAVSAAIHEGGIDLIHADHPEFGLSEAVAVMEQTKRKPDRDVDKLFSLVGKMEGKSQIEPMEAPGDVVTSELFDHQKEALGWLVHREESDDLPPFWEESEGGFENALTGQDVKERPPPLKGGIFADDMGLGKTLTLLSLIGRSKALIGDAKKANGAKRRKVKGAGEAPRPTLVVCPPSVFSAWVTQLEEHMKPGCLKVYLYHGERTKDMKELLKYDLVLTTYTTLGAEFEQEDSPVKDIDWFRVILDEAHVIKNPAARQTKAVIALNTERRWVVTGTPIQNSSFDLYPLMAFLRFQPFAIKSYWQSLIQRPLEKGDKTGLSRLQVSSKIKRLYFLLISLCLVYHYYCATSKNQH
jgi:SWI/SNF-related matrix-associated actin-dependent regulator of chromatin subfamily A3